MVDDEALEDLRELAHAILRLERADVHQLRVHQPSRPDRREPVSHSRLSRAVANENELRVRSWPAAARIRQMSPVGHQDDVGVADHHPVREVGDPPKRTAPEALFEQAREQVVLVEDEAPVKSARGERQGEQRVRWVVRVEKVSIAQERAEPADEELRVCDGVFSEQPGAPPPFAIGSQ